MNNKLLDYFNGDELAAPVWKRKYAIEGEVTPDDMHKRMAKEFHRVDKNYQRKEEHRYMSPPVEEASGLSKYGYRRVDLTENDIYKLFKDFKYIVPQGSIMSQLGAPSIGSLSNCFNGDVKVLTRQGWKEIRDLEGMDVEIMTKGGGWTAAPFKSYGYQNLTKVVLSNGHAQKEILATDKHRWALFKKSKPDTIHKVVTTEELQEGNVLYSTYGKGRGFKPSPFGVAHGVVFGDGHTVKNINYANNISLCAESRELSKYFRGCYVSSDESLCEGGSDLYSHLPNYYRELPNIEENKSYLYGWLSGYFAADGCIDTRGAVMINSVNIDNIKHVIDVCGVLGIGCTEVTEQTVISNLTHRKHTMYKTFIHKNHLTEDFFILDKHKSRYKNTNREPSRWKVEAVVVTDRLEKVFCAEVPKTESFVIEGNILSYNCFVAGQPHDSYGGIMQKDQELVQLMKRRGGVGLDISTLRPSGTATTNSAKSSTGAVSFMERFSNSTREVAQNGRRGALMLSVDVRHPDVADFVTVKNDETKVTGANISVFLRDDFMEAVEKDEDYFLTFPCELELLPGDLHHMEREGLEYDKLYTVTEKRGYIKKVKAKELYNKIINSAWLRAEPGQLFLDKFHNYSPDGAYPQYRGVTTNPCFTGDMSLLTSEGYKSFEELEGTELDLINKDGDTIKGTVWCSGVKPVVKVSTWNKQQITCTEDHTFMNTQGESIQAKDLKGYRLMPFYTMNNEVSEFTKLGFLQGDACLTRLNSEGHLGLEINIGEKDEDIADLFKIDYNKEVKSYYTTGYNLSLKTLKFQAKVLPERGLPETISDWDKKDILMFLKGLYSANGSIIKGQRIALKSTCKELVDGIKLIFEDLNIRAYITTNKTKEVKFKNGTYLCKESYDLNISTFDSVKRFAEEIGFVHAHKTKSLEELILVKAPKVSKVTQTGVSEKVYDFNLQDDIHWGVVEGVVVHNCSEIFMQTYDACRLIAVNLFSFVENPFAKDAYFNFDKFYRYNYETQRLMDDLVDLELEHIDRILAKIEADPEPENIKRAELELWTNIRTVAASGRRTGTGITALGDTLAAVGLKYDSEEGIVTIEKIMRTKMQSELDCGVDLAILRGPFEGWDSKIEFPNEEGANDFYTFILREFPEQAMRMMRHGRRNVSWSTIAPTGTVSLMTQTSSGLEPIFQPFYTRRVKVNPNDPTMRVDFVDKMGDEWMEQAVLHPKFKMWVEDYLNNWEEVVPNEIKKPEISSLTQKQLQDLFESSPWYGSTANDIDWQKRVKIQGIIQKYISHSISSTINLPNDVTEDEVRDIYISSWKEGLKGVTVYRDGCRSGVLITKEEGDEIKFLQHNAPKRPKALDAEVYHITSKGERFTVVTGLLEDKPYEVFCLGGEQFKHQEKGRLEKKARGRYTFNGIDLDFNISDEEVALTRMISTSLRHGADIKYVVEQLNKADGTIVSFSKAIARTLKKHIPDGEKSTVSCNDCGSSNVIFEEGCNKCLDCGSSACG